MVGRGGKGSRGDREARCLGPTFASLAGEWWQGVAGGAIGKRKGRSGSGYTPTTLDGYHRSLRYVLIQSSAPEQQMRSTPANGRRESID